MSDKPKTVPFLTKVHLIYIRDQMNKISAEEIAKDLKVKPHLVKKQIAMYRAEDGANPPVPTEGMGKAPVTPNRFAVVSPATGQPLQGVAVMSPQQSQLDDESAGTSPFSCGVLTEAQRQYIRDNVGKLPPEQIARNTGLQLFEVNNIIQALNPALTGREKFLERNRSTIHKLRPNEPIR